MIRYHRSLGYPARLRRRGYACLWVVGVCLLLLASGCSGGDSSKDDDLSELVLGKVAGKEFTVGDLQKKLEYQYGSQLAEITGEQAAEQHLEIVKAALDELCWVTLGEKRKYTKDPSFVDTWELSRRFILARTTVQREVKDKAEPTDEEIRVYYDENQKDFLVPERVQIAHVQTTNEREASEAYRRLRQGEPLQTVVDEMSIDTITRETGGSLGWVTARSGTAHLGRVADINNIAMMLQVGEIGGPIRLPGDRGWSVIVATDRAEETVRSLEEPDVYQAARTKVQTQNHNNIFRGLIGELRDEYKYEFYEDAYVKYEASLMSDEEFFTRAAKTKSPDEKLKIYRRLLIAYPDSRYAPQAQFMVGFLLADEMEDYDEARTEFERFIDVHPDHELAESARWMIENMEQPDADPEEIKAVRRKATIR